MVCNRPPPKLPLTLGKRDAFTLEGNAVAIPLQIDAEVAPSELTATAMVMISGQEPMKVAFSPSWNGKSMGVPLERVAATVPNGSRVTLAVELAHASGASGWSEAMLLERNDQGWRKVPLRGSGGRVGIDVEPPPPITGAELAAMAVNEHHTELDQCDQFRGDKENGYQQLDSAANTVGGQLNTNWDAMKGTNGVDH
jgi:hypothetical protein